MQDHSNERAPTTMAGARQFHPRDLLGTGYSTARFTACPVCLISRPTPVTVLAQADKASEAMIRVMSIMEALRIGPSSLIELGVSTHKQ